MASSIASLPGEILVLTFEVAVEGDLDYYLRQRTVICLVCKSWLTIVQNTPSLWTRIDKRLSGPRNILSLTRSRNHPLDVTFIHSPTIRRSGSISYSFSQMTATEQESFQLACKQLERWRSADLSLRLEGPLLQLLTAPAPIVEDVKITANLHAAKEYFVDLFGGQADRLRSLELHRVTIPWTSGILSGLRVLKLDDISHLPPTAGDLLAILAASPQLSTLTLSSIECSHTLPSTDVPIVNLPLLLTLTLMSFPSLVINYLLTHIHSPPSRNLILQHNFDAGNVDSSFYHPMTPFVPVIPLNGARMEIRLSNAFAVYDVLATDETRRILEVALDGMEGSTPASTFIETLLSSIPAAYASVPVSILIEDDATIDDVDALFAAARTLNVTTLTVLSGDDGANVESMLKRLGRVEAPTGLWFLPRLEHLSIEMGSVASGLLRRMVEARYAPGGPVPFASLIVRDDQPRHQRECLAIQGIVGAEVFEWKR